jgi:hypothetical protein
LRVAHKKNPRRSRKADRAAAIPGIGVKAGEFLIAKDPMLLGADTAPVEV